MIHVARRAASRAQVGWAKTVVQAGLVTHRVPLLQSFAATSWAPMLRQPRAPVAARHLSTCSLFPSESAFHAEADKTLVNISDNLALLEDEFDLELEYAQGVLSVEVPSHGKWVLNKQAPNQQIWWSSPVSGPLRFECKKVTGQWVSTRNANDSLLDLLNSEMTDALGTDIAWTAAE